MINGISEEEKKVLCNLVLEPLKENNVVVWVFGSRARDDYKKFSDIDLLYQEDDSSPLPPTFIYDLELLLEESNLPYKVELVNIDTLAESYKESVLNDRKKL